MPARFPDELRDHLLDPRHRTDGLSDPVGDHRLQWAAVTFAPIAFDDDAARAYGRAVGAVRHAGRRERSRTADLMIAATAAAAGLALYTRNPDDFVGLEALVEIRPV